VELRQSTTAEHEDRDGLYKTELIKPRGPWKTVDDVEIATAEWVDWFNHRRLYQYCGDIPPAALEAAYYAHTSLTPAG
jgi:putative transposase